MAHWFNNNVHFNTSETVPIALQTGCDCLSQVLWSEEKDTIQLIFPNQWDWKVQKYLGPLKYVPQNQSLKSSFSSIKGGVQTLKQTPPRHVRQTLPCSHFCFHNWQGLNAANQQMSGKNTQWTQRIHKWQAGDRQLQQLWPPKGVLSQGR